MLNKCIKIAMDEMADEHNDLTMEEINLINSAMHKLKNVLVKELINDIISEGPEKNITFSKEFI